MAFKMPNIKINDKSKLPEFESTDGSLALVFESKDCFDVLWVEPTLFTIIQAEDPETWDLIYIHTVKELVRIGYRGVGMVSVDANTYHFGYPDLLDEVPWLDHYHWAKEEIEQAQVEVLSYQAPPLDFDVNGDPAFNPSDGSKCFYWKVAEAKDLYSVNWVHPVLKEALVADYGDSWQKPYMKFITWIWSETSTPIEFGFDGRLVYPYCSKEALPGIDWMSLYRDGDWRERNLVDGDDGDDDTSNDGDLIGDNFGDGDKPETKASADFGNPKAGWSGIDDIAFPVEAGDVLLCWQAITSDALVEVGYVHPALKTLLHEQYASNWQQAYVELTRTIARETEVPIKVRNYSGVRYAFVALKELNYIDWVTLYMNLASLECEPSTMHPGLARILQVMASTPVLEDDTANSIVGWLKETDGEEYLIMGAKVEAINRRLQEARDIKIDSLQDEPNPAQLKAARLRYFARSMNGGNPDTANITPRKASDTPARNVLPDAQINPDGSVKPVETERTPAKVKLNPVATLSNFFEHILDTVIFGWF